MSAHSKTLEMPYLSTESGINLPRNGDEQNGKIGEESGCAVGGRIFHRLRQILKA